MLFDSTRHRQIAYLVGQCDGFEWDEGNRDKNWIAHQVMEHEAEEAFVSRPLMFFDDPRHSRAEFRYVVYGKTGGNRLLTVVFTIRQTKIRVISARSMSDRDRRIYAAE